MSETIIILVLAFLVDYFLGDPVYPLHPVRLIGILIAKIEKGFEALHFFNIWAGSILILGVVFISISCIYWFGYLLVPFEIFLYIFLVYSFLAGRDLINHANRVYLYLEQNNINEARKSVSYIVGRQTQNLSASQISRAAIESVAENYTDGVLSPIFWYFIGAVVGLLLGLDESLNALVFLLVFKIVSTLDSMIGYKNEKYIKFGKVAAKLDDVLNFIPARLSIIFISAGAFCSGLQALNSWRIGWRDRLKHSSPNAAHSESAVAGALGIQLGGPTEYSFGRVQKPTLGDEVEEVHHSHLLKANHLITKTYVISLIFFVITLALIDYILIKIK